MDNYVFKKPLEVPEGKQLFSSDCNMKGAKKFIITTFEKAYKIIKETKNLYEDQTFNNKIKLHIDIDYNKVFTTDLHRDKLADEIIENVINKVNDKIKEVFNIENPEIIILISDTLNKLSLHIIYVNIVFSSIVDMKFFFMNVSNYVDMNIYKRGCFRLYKCSKLGKNNKLIYYQSLNYNKPKDKYLFFLDTCITYTNITNVLTYSNNNIIKKFNNFKNPTSKLNHANYVRNYIYKHYNLEKVKEALELWNINNYNDWLTISYAIKDLYLGITDEKEQDELYYIYDEICSKSDKYDEDKNFDIFYDLKPLIDINYIFSNVDTNYFIHPFYNYKKLIFNLDKYQNKILQDSKFIDIDIDEIIKYNIIYLKSPTGTGKTTILKQLISKIGLNSANLSIISITSRVNLAGEHVKNLGLEFYKNINPTDMKYCDNLVVQLESIWKCNYKNFKNGIVILDEVNSLLSHLRSPTFINKRRECYTYIIEIIKNAKYVICLDADLSDWNIEFINMITQKEYIVYQNICKNKININATFYHSDQIMIDIMSQHIEKNNYFVACFDSLSKMKLIIEYLSKSRENQKNSDWLIYSSEVEYDLIDTKTWIKKFVFFTPTIIYGIDYNENITDVFCFVHKFHLNPLQVYQMINRVRKINNVYVYCHEKLFYLKYKSIDDVKDEFYSFEKNLIDLVPDYNDYCKIDEEPYKVMYFNFKYMDSLLKTNIKEYLMDMMLEYGFNINENKVIVGKKYNKPKEETKVIKDKIVELLNLDKENMTDFEKELTSNDKKLDKHFNLRIYLKNNYDIKLTTSIDKNLLTETISNKNIKIKIFAELMNVLQISNLESFDKNVSKNFNTTINNIWLNENMETIMKIFDIRGKKYKYTGVAVYYTIYQLLITIFKNIFDEKLLISKKVKIDKITYYYYLINKDIIDLHKNIISKIDNILFLD